jgi:hypothetical protein
MVGYHYYRGLSCLHLEVEVDGAGKNGIDIGMEYKRGQSPGTASRK